MGSVIASFLLMVSSQHSPSQHQATGENEIQQCVDWLRSRHQAPARNTALTLVVSDDTACFDGEIFSQTVGKLNSWLGSRAAVGGGPKYLVVRSKGGEATAGILLAEKLQKHNVTSVIVDYCMSSCANYLFAGVARRRLIGQPVMLFHGGFSPVGRKKFAASVERSTTSPEVLKYIKDVDSWRAKQLSYYDGGLAMQDRLYRSVRVNPKIATDTDFIDMSSISDKRCGGASKDVPRDMMFFSKKQLKRLGVTIESGILATNPVAINQGLKALGVTSAACAIPENFVDR